MNHILDLIIEIKKLKSCDCYDCRLIIKGIGAAIYALESTKDKNKYIELKKELNIEK